MTTVSAGQSQTVSIPEGFALSIIGLSGTVGTAYLLSGSSGTNSTKSWPISTGGPQIGPYSEVQRVLVTCSIGSIDVVVRDAVLGTAPVVVVPTASGDATGVTDDFAINNAIAIASSSGKQVLIRKGDGGIYWTAGGIRHSSNVIVEIESGTTIKTRSRIIAAVTNIAANVLTLDSVDGIVTGMQLSDASITPATFQADGLAFGGIPFGVKVGVVNAGAKTITMVAGVGGAAVNPTSALASGINIHPRANTWTFSEITDFALVCKDGWATLDGNWSEAYPYNANSDDAFRNAIRAVSCQRGILDGIEAANAFYHGMIAVGSMQNIDVRRFKATGNGYRSIHFHSEAVVGNAQPEVSANHFGRIELRGNGHRAFYTRNNDDNNSGLFLLFENCLSTMVDSVYARDEYGFTFAAAGGPTEWGPGNWSKYATVGQIIQRDCGEGVLLASNLKSFQGGDFSAWGRELVIASCVFGAAASVNRYVVDSAGTVRSFKTKLIDIPNVSGVGAIAAYNLRPGYRVFASGGSTGMNTVYGTAIWECLVGTGAGGVDQIRVFRDLDANGAAEVTGATTVGVLEPYTTAATVAITVHGMKGSGVALYAASGETVRNVKFSSISIDNAALGITCQAASGVYRYNDIDFGSVTVRRGYRQGVDLSSIRDLKMGLHTEDCASGFTTGGGGLSRDNYIQNCTGKIRMTSAVNTGFVTTNKLITIDTECRALDIDMPSIKKSSAGQLMVEGLVTAGAVVNAAGVSGPVVLVNPRATDGTPLTISGTNISRTDASAIIITRPVDAA